MFGPEELRGSIRKALADHDVPEGSKRAFVVVATTTGATGVFTEKLNDVWEVSGAFAIDSERHVEAGVSVKAVW